MEKTIEWLASDYVTNLLLLVIGAVIFMLLNYACDTLDSIRDKIR
ncbi:hypothetical protein PQZ12_01235 [Methylophilaceae bacterium]|nr:hypothetical protein [Methylophilaceae bacterium]